MDSSAKKDLILNGDIKKAILVLGAPIMLNNLLQTVYNLVDTYWVGKLGSTEIAAMSFTFPIVFMLLSLCIGMAMGGTALIAQYVGAKRHEDAERVAGQLVLFGIVLSVIGSIGGYLAAPSILRLMGATGGLYDASLSFISVMMLGSPTMFAFFIFSSIKQGQGDTKTPMIYGMISIIMNMILDPIFIFTFNWGIAGAAVATVFSRGVVSVYAFYKLFNEKDGIQLKKSLIKYNKAVLTKVVKLGAPSALGQSAEAIGFMVLSSIVVTFGDNTVAAMGIGNRLNSLLIMPAMGFSTALITIVGQNLGNDNVERAKEAVKWSMAMSLVVMIAASILVFARAELFVGIFASEADVIAQASTFLRLLCVTIPFFGLFQSLVGTFQGSGHMVTAMCMMMGRLWVIRIPLILLLVRILGDPNAIWYGISFSNVIMFFIAFGVFLTGKWQKKVIKDEEKVEVEESCAA